MAGPTTFEELLRKQITPSDTSKDKITPTRDRNPLLEALNAERQERRHETTRHRTNRSNRPSREDALEELHQKSGKQSSPSLNARSRSMHEEEGRIVKEIEKQERLIGGNQRQIETLQSSLDELGLIDRMVGTSAAIEKDIAATKKLATEQQKRLKELQERSEELKKLRLESEASEQRGKQLEAKGHLHAAQKAYNDAAVKADEFSSKAGLKCLVVNDEYQTAQSAVRKDLEDAIQTADTAYKVAKTTQTVLIIAGATIATGGVAGVAIASSGLLVGGATAIAAGTAAGTAIGAVSAVAEAGGSVALGQKTAEEAMRDAATQTAGYAKDSLVAAGGTLVGIGIGGKVAGAVVGRLEGVMSQGAARVTAGALNGGAAGGANSVASTGVAVGEQYVAARREFARSIEGQKLTSQEFDEAYESFMSRRGMTFETIATQFGREVALGILSGKIGGATGAVKQGARTTIQKFATESGEVVANAGIGLGVAAVQGDLSVEGVTNVLAGTAVGTVTGRVSHEYARPIVNEIPVKLEHAAATSKRALRGSPTMNNVVEQMLFDTAHPMDVTRNLQHRGRQIPATHGLQEFASAPRINEQDFISFINEGSVQPLPFKNNDRELSYHHDRKRAEILRESLLLQDPELYGVSNNPSPRQLAKVRHYAEHLREQSLPDLVDSINTVVGPRDIDGFPTVNARAKGASGLIDKIDRMRTGNFGKEPRPDYVLADMPDALGARITVKDPRDLPAIIERFEAQYQGRIIEKDNFYTNPSKREKPYRVITYTVMTGDVPCEVQITTLASSLAADINHNTVYKQILPTTEEQRRELIDRWHGVTKRETELLLKNNFWPRS